MYRGFSNISLHKLFIWLKKEVVIRTYESADII